LRFENGKNCTPVGPKHRLRGTLTRNIYRVNFEVNNLKPFPHLAFPHSATSENSSKKLGFDGELMASPCLAPARFLIVGVMTIFRQLVTPI
jgi:hypothetical protein